MLQDITKESPNPRGSSLPVLFPSHRSPTRLIFFGEEKREWQKSAQVPSVASSSPPPSSSLPWPGGPASTSVSNLAKDARTEKQQRKLPLNTPTSTNITLSNRPTGTARSDASDPNTTCRRYMARQMRPDTFDAEVLRQFSFVLAAILAINAAGSIAYQAKYHSGEKKEEEAQLRSVGYPGILGVLLGFSIVKLLALVGLAAAALFREKYSLAASTAVLAVAFLSVIVAAALVLGKVKGIHKQEHPDSQIVSAAFFIVIVVWIVFESLIVIALLAASVKLVWEMFHS